MRNRRKFWLLMGAMGVTLALCVMLFSFLLAPPQVADAQSSTPAPTNTVWYGSRSLCQTYTSRDVPKLIPDNTLTRTISTLPVTMLGRISDVTVTLAVSHTYPYDLAITLCSPVGDCRIINRSDTPLTWRSGYYTVTFSSNAVDPLPADRPYNGVYQASDTLTALRGKIAAGTWSLALRDEASGDTGSLQAWSLGLCGSPGAVTPTPAATPNSQCVMVYTGDPVSCLTPEATGEWLTEYSTQNTLPYGDDVISDSIGSALGRYLCVFGTDGANVGFKGHTESTGSYQAFSDGKIYMSIAGTLLSAPSCAAVPFGGGPIDTEAGAGEDVFPADDCPSRSYYNQELSGTASGRIWKVYIGGQNTDGDMLTRLQMKLNRCGPTPTPQPTSVCPTPTANPSWGWWIW